MIAFLNIFAALLPFVFGAAQIDDDVELGVNVSSEMSLVVADEPSSTEAVESTATANSLISITIDWISVLDQFSDSWILIIDCGDDPEEYEVLGEYGRIL